MHIPQCLQQVRYASVLKQSTFRRIYSSGEPRPIRISFDPILATTFSTAPKMAQPTDPDSQLIEKVTAYVQQYMSHYDGSHDYAHIQRVLALARQIAPSPSPSPSPVAYDPLTITLSALLHDVGDKKYLQPGEDAGTLVQNVLLGFGAPEDLARKVQAITSAVSYSSEIKNPGRVREVMAEFPELAVVQDADRLDALGAVGVGRAFTFGGAKGRGRGMEETIEHFTEKLERLEGMMKTEVGRRLARKRTERLRVFRGWWEEEEGLAEVFGVTPPVTNGSR
jgi:uncharacterized protein